MGEFALLASDGQLARRSSSLRVRGHAELYSLARDDFLEVVAMVPAVQYTSPATQCNPHVVDTIPTPPLQLYTRILEAARAKLAVTVKYRQSDAYKRAFSMVTEAHRHSQRSLSVLSATDSAGTNASVGAGAGAGVGAGSPAAAIPDSEEPLADHQATLASESAALAATEASLRPTTRSQAASSAAHAHGRGQTHVMNAALMTGGAVAADTTQHHHRDVLPVGPGALAAALRQVVRHQQALTTAFQQQQADTMAALAALTRKVDALSAVTAA